MYAKGFYRWLHDDELPKEFRLALKRMPKLEHADRVPVTEEERDKLLVAADEGIMRHPAARRKALIWLLWDSGFRISEAISLRISDIHFDDRGGANLRLRPGTPGLKTGARTIYVVDCVPSLRLWLAFHPHRDDPEAAVFNSRNDAREPMWPSNAATMLKRFSERAGIRHMHPHLFRHTRATRAAEVGWNEPQMRAYFGWGKSSHMPAHYIHLSQRSMEDRVRRDSGIDTTGHRQSAKPAAPADGDDMDDRLKKAFRRFLLDD